MTRKMSRREFITVMVKIAKSPIKDDELNPAVLLATGFGFVGGHRQVSPITVVIQSVRADLK